MSETYVSNGARLQFTQRGAGMPVVYLHPTPLDHAYWLPMVSRLEGVRAILPDFRGHGASELGADLPVGGFARVPDAAVLTMEQLAADVLALLDRLSVDAAVFAGCSIGGYVLLELWRQAPRRMRGLAFVCSKPQPDGEGALAKRVENIARIRADGASGFFDTMAQTLPGATSRRDQPAMVPELRARMSLTPEAVVAVQAGLAVRPDSMPAVRSMTVPVLAIAGGEDGSIAPADMEVFREAPGGCEYHLIADAGHLAAREQPERVAELFRPWLRKLDL